MKKVFSIIFCFIIVIPAFQTFVRVFPEIKIEEKRVLATFPKISLSEKTLEGLTNYFNDNFGLRGSLIFMNNYIDLSVFKISPNSQVIIGKNGWMYYQPSYESNSLVLNQMDVELVSRKIYDFQKKVEADGKKFVFVLAPDKESIYPEFLKDKLVGLGNYELITNVLKQNNVNTFDGLKLLQDAKGKGSMVYSKNDTHWTRYGLFLTINEMFKALGRSAIDSSGVEDVQRVGDLSLLVGFNNSETVPQPIVDNSKVVAKDRVLIFHDSFFDNEMYFTLLFKNFKKIHWATGPIEKEYVDLENSYDVVIMEIAERDFIKLGTKL
ncbi:MAG: hypothetical protein NTZ25_02550 [Candidatus Peregrinibacteria bacterium]|nr:hypothetical protein [Candidatus Peregrinibacteria bacterium]